jgi:uncharacterized lipoprotein YddW (UPF0748 family)
MIQKLKPASLSILLAAVLLFSAHWALTGSGAAHEKSAPLSLDTCSAWRATAAQQRVWRGEHCLDQRPIAVTGAYTIYLPVINRNYPIAEEFRGLWVTRFDWTRFGHTVTRSDLDAIVTNAAAAHFNVLLFQVRGTADAYYSSTLEPWAARLTGSTTKTLGTDPGFDPLAYLITRAHQSGLQVHAYINVYPVWLCDRVGPITSTTPQHPFWQWTYASPLPNRTLQWREWTNGNPSVPMNLIPTNEGGTCGGANYLDGYLWASPANPIVQSHILSVAVDLAARYQIDGLHLDLVRYSGSNYSSDPATRQAFSEALKISPTLVFTAWRPQFQRDQVSGLVARIYSATTALKPDLLVSAAVWFSYTDGYNNYYQDSKGWLANGNIDANVPMLYSSDILNDLPAWTARAQGFIADSYGRYVFPGISADYSDVNQITDRIEAARSFGAKGVVLFSYGALITHSYWSDLANGPFAITATVPRPNWKP